MAENPRSDNPSAKKGFSKGNAEQSKRKAGTGRTVKDTAKTREAKASKGGRERRPG